MSSNAVSNGRVRIRPGLARLMATEPEPIAEGVWVMRGGFPLKSMNVYFVRDGDGVLLFDAGISDMTAAVARGAAQLGGLTRIVLGHGHPDHRGVAPGLEVPTYCHPDEVADAEGDGGCHYFTLDELDPHGRFLLGSFLPMWDGGPVKIAGTVSEGDDVAGFKVVHLPGHAPGLIGLWRETRPPGAGQRHLLHGRSADRHPRPRARPPPGLQQRHRAGARVDPQARRAGAGNRLGRPRRTR